MYTEEHSLAYEAGLNKSELSESDKTEEKFDNSEANESQLLWTDLRSVDIKRKFHHLEWHTLIETNYKALKQPS